jgi:hypothetical protein
MDVIVKTSGEKREFATGSVRDTAKGKPRFDLMPAFVKTMIGMHYGKGGDHYGDRNWERGQPICGSYAASLERHWLAFQCGMTDEHHLMGVIWNATSIVFTLAMIKAGKLPKELDDRPYHMQEGNLIGKELYESIHQPKKEEKNV